MYVVNFTNNNGIVLVAADKRTEPIFAFVDEGNLDFYWVMIRKPFFCFNLL